MADVRMMKYARALKTLEYGYQGYCPALFRSITLTTREGDDNTSATFLKDLKVLIKDYRDEG